MKKVEWEFKTKEGDRFLVSHTFKDFTAKEFIDFQTKETYFRAKEDWISLSNLFTDTWAAWVESVDGYSMPEGSSPDDWRLCIPMGHKQTALGMLGIFIEVDRKN